MNKNLIHIDISNSKEKDDLIKIRFRDEEFLEINFSKLFNESKNLRNKYKYSDAMDSIQYELDEFSNKFNNNDESMKIFIQIIEEEKMDFAIEQYKDIYALSEYFCIPTITSVLDKISLEYLYKDLNFTIQILIDYQKADNTIETKLINKIENFLSARMNECIVNAKFKELPISTIYRLFERSKEKIDYNLLFEFIFESAKSRIVLFKFIEFDQLIDEKVKILIKFIEEQDEYSRKMYLEYIPFNLSLIKNMIYKYDQLFNEMNETKINFDKMKQELDQTKQELNQAKQELNQTKQELDQTKQELNQTKQELNQTKQELKETKQELNQTKQELDQSKKKENQTKQELNQTKQELKETKQELNQTKQELNQTKKKENQTKQELNQAKLELSECKREIKQAKNVFNPTKSEKQQYTQSIIVGGRDCFNELGVKPNNKAENGKPTIVPPVKLS